MSEGERIGLPPRIFMYTADQVASMLEVELKYVKSTLFFYDKREPGLTPKTKMRAINIAPEGETPEWRVTEREFIRYLRSRGLRFYERGLGL
jgi:hypothetical protein